MSPLPHKALRIIISGGGTGGHIFPAIAIANALKSADPRTEILFVGAEGKMEMEKVPAAGYTIKGLPIAGIKREFSLDNLSFPFKLIRSLSMAGKIIRDFKPDAAVGVGGYASGPLLFMASRQGIPALIQEQNSFPGITNKLLSRKANAICVAYEGMERFFPAGKIVFTGNPVRNDIRNTEGKRSEAAAFFGLDAAKKTILVTGGSQGARSINNAMLEGLGRIAESGVQLLWQTGKFFYPNAKQATDKLQHPAVKAFEFISRMDLAYALSDVVVGRAGASTVSELCIVRKPSILVPLPTAAEDHQTKNCEALVRRDAALLVKDAEASSVLVTEALALMADEEKCKKLAANIAPLARPQAAEDIARQIFKIVQQQ